MANAALERQVRDGLYVRVGSHFSKELYFSVCVLRAACAGSVCDHVNINVLTMPLPEFQ
jgi:hypothetical protein